MENETQITGTPDANDLSNLAFEARAQIIQDQLEKEAPATPPAGEQTEQQAAEPAKAAEKEQPAQPAEVSDARKARQERLKAVMERAKSQLETTRAKQAAHPADNSAQLTQLQQQMAALAAERDALMTQLKDPLRFFEAADKANVDKRAMAEWIQKSITDPAQIAAMHAEKTLSTAEERMLAKMQEMFAPVVKRLETIEGTWQDQATQYQEQQALNTLCEFANSADSTNPLAHSYLQARGPEAFYKYISAVGQKLPDHCGPQALLDALEEDLEEKQLSVTTVTKSSNGTRNGSATKAPALTNSKVSQRTEVDEQVDLASLPFEERLAKLMAE